MQIRMLGPVGAVEQLLLAVAQVDGQCEEDLATARTLTSPLYVVEQAREHGVEALLRSAVDKHPSVWPELTALLAQTAAGYLAWISRTFVELQELVGRLTAANIPYAVVKGPILAAYCYGSARLRAFGDVDVLVNSADVESAIRALEITIDQAALENARMENRGQIGVQLRRGTTLDLHWELINDPAVRASFRLETAELLGRTRTIDVFGTSVSTLDETDFVLHLCSHTAVSGGYRLGWYVDLDRTLRRELPDPDEFRHRAKLAGLSLTAAVLFRRCRRQLGSPTFATVSSPGRWVWILLGRALDRVPISSATSRPHRGQLYFRSTRSGLLPSVRAAGELGLAFRRSHGKGKRLPAAPPPVSPGSTM